MRIIVLSVFFLVQLTFFMKDLYFSNGSLLVAKRANFCVTRIFRHEFIFRHYRSPIYSAQRNVIRFA